MTVSVHVHGKILEGFARGSIQLTMEEPANIFDVEYVASGHLPGERLMYEGDPCELAIDGDVIVGGYVDTVTEVDEPDRLTLRAVGRSKTEDLVDCSAAHLTFANAKVSTIASRLAREVSVAVSVAGDEGEAFDAWHVQKGESIIDAINRACSKRGLYAYTVGSGLVLARAGATRTKTRLVRGENVRNSERTGSLYSRYSDYVFRGQMPATDGAWGAKAAHLKQAVQDPGVPRYRPLTLTVETHGPGDLRTRAEVERNTRAGRSEQISVRVSGHKTVEGYTWRPNLLVPYENPVLGVNATLLVIVARMRFGENEDDDTELVLARPESFDLVNYPAIGRGSLWT